MSTTPPEEQTLSKVAGSVYGPVISDQLARERERKTSIEGRAVQVVSISTLSATLLTGLVANALPKPSSAGPGVAAASPLSGEGLVAFQFALGALVAAVIFGAVANWRGNGRRSFGGLRTDSGNNDDGKWEGGMEDWTDQKLWKDSDLIAAGLNVAKVQLLRLGDARRRNREKKWYFTTAVAFQAAALIAVLVAVIIAPR